MVRRVLLACLGASALLASCARPAPRRLVIATVRQPATSLVFVALGSGCFAREGLVLEEKQFELGRDALALLASGGADAAVAFETPFLAAAREDPALRVLTALHSSSRNTRLVTPRGAAIRDFADLAGKRVGLAPGTNAEFFLDLALQYAGVRQADVEVVGLPPDESIAELRTGEIDAAVLSDPPAAHAEAALGDAAVVLRSDLYVEFSLLVARADTIERRPADLEALLRGLACGERLTRTRLEEALTLLPRRFPELPRPALRAQVARVTWGLGLDHLLAEVLRDEGEWLTARAPAAPVPPPAQLLDPRLLVAVDPDAVVLMPAPAW